MKAIYVYNLPDTGKKPRRVIAKAEGGHKLIMTYNGPETAGLACKALANRLGWGGVWVAGGMPDGQTSVYVIAKISKRVTVREWPYPGKR